MKLTKYEHACLTFEKDGKVLVIDPGIFTTNLPMLENVVAVIVTHAHPDHFDPNALEALFASNPKLTVYSPKQVNDQIQAAYSHKQVLPGEKLSIDGFELEFYGGQHARVHDPLTPIFDNVGVMINEIVYYPGDSFELPSEKHIPVLALPVSGPWLRVGTVMDFILAAKADRAFYTHDALWSEKSKSFEVGYLNLAAEKVGTTLQEINGSIEIDG